MSVQATELTRSIHERLEHLAKAVEEQRASDDFRRYLDVMARFPRYSWRNCLLIEAQRPGSSLIAGFRHWKKLGRSIRAGEKAIRILAPCPVRRRQPQVQEQHGDNHSADEDERLFFKTASVFDQRQTTGKDLPEFNVPDVEASADNLLKDLQQVAAKRGIVVNFTTMEKGAYGASKGGVIEIAMGYSTGQQAKTLSHEICHEALHRCDNGHVDHSVRKEIRELEAEATAYIVCRHFGLDVELRASRYIAWWQGDAKALAASFGRISRTARVLIEDVGQLRANAAPCEETRSSATSPQAPATATAALCP